MATPYMNLTLPTPSVSLGPAWATSLNTAITAIDSHNHTTGQGQQVPSAGININADLAFNSFNCTLLRSTRFVSQGSPLALGPDANCVYVSGGNLYYNNGSGTAVQITSGTTLAASSLGGISGLSGTTGSASYNSGTGTFTWWQNTNTSAIMDVGPLVIHDTVASALGITIKSPSGLAGAYSITLPSALPGATSLLTLSATGTLASSAGLSIDGTSNLTHTASSWTIGTGDSQPVIFKTNAVNRWQVASTGELQAQGGNRAIQNVLDPVSAQDAATKNYVDGKVIVYGSLSFQNTTSTNPTFSSGTAYTAGSSAVITGTGNWNTTFAATGITVNATNGTIQVANAGTYEVRIMGHARQTTNAGTPQLVYTIRKNASITGMPSTCVGAAFSGTGFVFVSYSTVISLSANDTLDILIADSQNTTAAATMQWMALSFSVFKIS